MILIVYRWKPKPGCEAAFRAAWAAATDALRAHGAEGSVLCEAADGTLAAVARWPDLATRAAAFDALPEALAAAMADAVETRYDPLVLTAIDARWAPYPGDPVADA